MNPMDTLTSNGDWVEAGKALAQTLSRERFARTVLGILLLFRAKVSHWEFWDDVQERSADPQRWNEYQVIFEAIRSTVMKRPDNAPLLSMLDSMGECVCKTLSNASWSPGLYDADAGWHVPKIAMDLAGQLGEQDLQMQITSILNAHGQNEDTHNKCLQLTANSRRR